jgi:hypothetical protein
VCVASPCPKKEAYLECRGCSSLEGLRDSECQPLKLPPAADDPMSVDQGPEGQSACQASTASWKVRLQGDEIELPLPAVQPRWEPNRGPQQWIQLGPSGPDEGVSTELWDVSAIDVRKWYF